MRNRNEEIEVSLCTQNHSGTLIYFCKNCANSNMPMEKIFFCSQCNPNALNSHVNHHTERNVVTNQMFLRPYKAFKQQVKTINRLSFNARIRSLQGNQDLSLNDCFAIMKTYLAANTPNYYNALITLDIPKELLPYNYRKWLVENKFWNSSYSTSINRSIQDYIVTVIAGENKPNQWDNFKVEIGQSSGAAAEFEKRMESSKLKLITLTKEKQLNKLFMNIMSCFTNEQIEKGLKQINIICGKYNPIPFLVYLGKLKILQLHDQSDIKMKEVLKGLNIEGKSSREKQLFYYFSAVAEWKLVPEDEEQQQIAPIFYESRNKKNYKLGRPKEYIKFLTQAISICKRPLYYASRAIGSMISGDHKKAEQDFAEAEKLNFKNDAMDNNRNFNRLANRAQIDQASWRNELRERTTEYIVNIIKHLNKIKNYEDLKTCCSELIQREPNNVYFRCQMFQTQIKLKDIDGSTDQIGEIKRLNLLPEDEIIEYERKRQLLKAKQCEGYSCLSDAEDKYEHVAKVGKPSSTSWYNYAAFLFNYRDERDKNNKALQAINTAIQIKPKQKYYELKYLLLFVMGNMQEAKFIQSKIQDKKEFALMRQYINQNI